MHLASESAVRRRMADTPATYVAFDLLFLDGRSTVDLPYADRRRLLEQLALDGAGLLSPATTPATAPPSSSSPASAASRDSSPSASTRAYAPGRRSRAWVKVKNVRTAELVIGGWQPGQGGRASTLGSLALGYHDEPGRGNSATPARSAPASPSRRWTTSSAC